MAASASQALPSAARTPAAADAARAAAERLCTPQALGKRQILSETYPGYLRRPMKSSPFIARSFYACASLAALLFLLVPTIASAGAVYQCDGPDGQIAFTNKPSTFAH